VQQVNKGEVYEVTGAQSKTHTHTHTHACTLTHTHTHTTKAVENGYRAEIGNSEASTNNKHA
jgi:hypothetical protein